MRDEDYRNYRRSRRRENTDFGISEYKYGATICMADEVGKKLQKKEQNALMKLLHISEKKFWMKKESWTGQSFQTLFLPTGLNFLY